MAWSQVQLIPVEAKRAQLNLKPMSKESKLVVKNHRDLGLLCSRSITKSVFLRRNGQIFSFLHPSHFQRGHVDDQGEVDLRVHLLPADIHS